MDEPGLIVIGSGPGGVSAADAFRQHDRDLPVRILTADPELPYARPPLSKDYLRGDTDDVWLHPAHWYLERFIDLHLATEVVAIDPAAHTVTTDGGTYSYTALVLACGAVPTPLPVPGGHHALQLRSLADAARLRKAAGDAASAVVVGAGFIGCEVAASLALNGLAVTLVAPERVPQEKRLGAAAGRRLQALVELAGVRYVGGVAVRELTQGAVRLENGVSIDCDLIVAATGVTPRIDLAEPAGLSIQDSRVIVGADMRTSAPDVYAVGDLALAFNTLVGRRRPRGDSRSAGGRTAVDMARRTGLLEHHRRCHAEVPRLGRRLRTPASARPSPRIHRLVRVQGCSRRRAHPQRRRRLRHRGNTHRRGAAHTRIHGVMSVRPVAAPGFGCPISRERGSLQWKCRGWH
jgi:NAD(P)H-nitrite reductase large subunit